MGTRSWRLPIGVALLVTLAPTGVVHATSANAAPIGTVLDNVYPGPVWTGPADSQGYRRDQQVIVPQVTRDHTFFSKQWWFKESQCPRPDGGTEACAAYEGIQLKGHDPNGAPDVDEAIFSVWGGIDADAAPGSWCGQFEEFGDGYNCYHPLAIIAGHAYNTDVALDHTADGHSWWRGTVTDTTTGVSAELGTIEARDTQPMTAPVNFIEYFGFDTTGVTCDQYPYEAADFHTPALTPAVSGSTNAATLADPSARTCARGVETVTADGAHEEFGGPKPFHVDALTAIRNGTTATLSWSDPVTDSRYPLLNDLVSTSTDGGATWSADERVDAGAGGLTLHGLDPGPRMVRVAPVNAAGTGPYAYASFAGTASAPRSPTVVSGNGAASVTWSAPLSDGGTAVTGYQVTPYKAGAPQTPRVFHSTATTQNVTGLKNGANYAFRVSALTATGPGATSPVTATVRIGAPNAPSSLKAVAGRSAVTLRWIAPVNNGARINGYYVTPILAGGARPVRYFAGNATSVHVTGLNAGASYRFRIAAHNSRGTGPRSSLSNAVVPRH